MNITVIIYISFAVMICCSFIMSKSNGYSSASFSMFDVIFQQNV